MPSGKTFSVAVLKSPGFAKVRAEAVTVEARVPAYRTDPDAAVNADVIKWFSPTQRQFLKANGFVIVPEGPRQIAEIYKQAQQAGIPAFVTTDALLHAYHILYDYTLRHVEFAHLVGDLETLLEAMMDATQAQIKSAEVGPVREAATRNLAFFAVARQLLDPKSKAPKTVRKLVNVELELVEAHAGFARSPIFEYDEDYSQYVPRGHYTRNETFERYFRAMMWLGRIMFRLRPGNSAKALEVGRRETRQALLITIALTNTDVGAERAVDIWERIYEPTVFFVGKTDDLNVYDYNESLSAVFGRDVSLATLGDDARIDTFIQKASTLRPPKIVSSYVTDQEAPEEVTKGFRFMGQRFIPDSYIFQQLVYNKVGRYQGTGEPFTMEATAAGPVRVFPRGLDVSAVLGSERALAILEREGDTAYGGYDEQMSKLREEFASLPDEQWTENLYWGWLHTLRPMLEPKGKGYPSFMRSPLWVDKGLNAFLGSWSELRHDTILYAKQSYTLKATGMLPPERPKPPGYVEPEIEVWNRLLHLVRQTHLGLSDRGLLDEEFEERLTDMEELVKDLRDIALKELANRSLAPEEIETIERIGKSLERITTFSEKVKEEITSQADERMAIVADVHTDVNSGQVLEEGVGDSFTLYVVIPHGDETVVTMGGVFSHYEFKQPMGQRLTDEAWQEMEPKPPLAPWVQVLVQE